MTSSELNNERETKTSTNSVNEEATGADEEANASAEERTEELAKAENSDAESVKEPSPEDLAKEWQNKYLYLTAEFENFRKRMQKERADFLKYGHEDFLREQLMVVDNFARAIEAGKNSKPEKGTALGQMVEGLEMIMWQFLESLKNQGVTRIEALGQKFDPLKHEAIAQEEVEDREPNIVLKEESKGFMLYDRVLRASRVIVSKVKE